MCQQSKLDHPSSSMGVIVGDHTEPLKCVRVVTELPPSGLLISGPVRVIDLNDLHQVLMQAFIQLCAWAALPRCCSAAWGAMPWRASGYREGCLECGWLPIGFCQGMSGPNCKSICTRDPPAIPQSLSHFPQDLRQLKLRCAQNVRSTSLAACTMALAPDSGCSWSLACPKKPCRSSRVFVQAE